MPDQPERLEILFRTFRASAETARALGIDAEKLVHYAVLYYADNLDLDLDGLIQSMTSGMLSSVSFGDGTLDGNGKPVLPV